MILFAALNEFIERSNCETEKLKKFFHEEVSRSRDYSKRVQISNMTVFLLQNTQIKTVFAQISTV